MHDLKKYCECHDQYKTYPRMMKNCVFVFNINRKKELT